MRTIVARLFAASRRGAGTAAALVLMSVGAHADNLPTEPTFGHGHALVLMLALAVPLALLVVRALSKR